MVPDSFRTVFWYHSVTLFVPPQPWPLVDPMLGSPHGLTKGICRNVNESLYGHYSIKRPLTPGRPPKEVAEVLGDKTKRAFLRGLHGFKDDKTPCDRKPPWLGWFLNGSELTRNKILVKS